MGGGLLDGQCGALLHACCRRKPRTTAKMGELPSASNEVLALPADLGPVNNDPRKPRQYDRALSAAPAPPASLPPARGVRRSPPRTRQLGQIRTKRVQQPYDGLFLFRNSNSKWGSPVRLLNFMPADVNFLFLFLNPNFRPRRGCSRQVAWMIAF